MREEIEKENVSYNGIVLERRIIHLHFLFRHPSQSNPYFNAYKLFVFDLTYSQEHVKLFELWTVLLCYRNGIELNLILNLLLNVLLTLYLQVAMDMVNLFPSYLNLTVFMQKRRNSTYFRDFGNFVKQFYLSVVAFGYA